MRNRIWIVLTLASVLFVLSSLQAFGAKLLLSEEFTGETLPEKFQYSQKRGKSQWALQDGALKRVDKKSYATLTLSDDIPNLEKVEFRFKMLENAGAGQDWILDVSYKGCGQRVFFRNGMIASVNWKLYKENKKAGTINKKINFDPHKWHSFKLLIKNGAPAVYVDGNYILTGNSFDKDSDNKLKLGFWMMNGIIDDIKIYAGDADKTSTYNHQINSSFEFSTIPDDTAPSYWFERDSTAWGIPSLWSTEESYDEFHDKWGIDDKVYFKGAKSFRLAKPAVLIGTPLPIAGGTPVIVSVYMKAEKPGTKVRIGLGKRAGHSRGIKGVQVEKTVELSDSWKRYEVTLAKHKSGSLSFFAIPVTDGKVWLDAVQMETGGKATPYMRSPRDIVFEQPFFSQGQKVAATEKPSVKLKFGKPDALDGNLDDKAWAAVPAVKLKEAWGGETKLDTYVKFMRDGANLYFAFDCRDDDIASLVAVPRKRDGAVWGDDSVEIFIDPLGDGSLFYQLAFNALGSQFDTMKLDQDGPNSKWNGKWQARCAKNKKGWTAEVTIPFSTIGVEPDSISSLFMNVHRCYPRGPQKYSAWSPVKSGFHEPESFGEVFFGGKITPVEIETCELKCMSPLKNEYKFSFNLKSSGKIKASVEVIRANGRKDNFSEIVSGDVSLSFPLSDVVEDKLDVLITLADADSGMILKKKKYSLEVGKALEVFTEFTYYTSEKKARVAVEANLEGDKGANRILLEAFSKTGEKVFALESDGEKSGMTIIDLPLDKLSPSGSPYSLNVALKGNWSIWSFFYDWGEFFSCGKVLAKAETELKVLPPVATEVKTNRLNQGIYVNGKPFIPFGIMLTFPKKMDKYAGQIAFAKKYGMNFVVIIGHWYAARMYDLYFAEAAKQNMGVIDFLPMEPRRAHSKTPELVKKKLAALKGEKALLGVIVADEVGKDPDWVYKAVEIGKKVNPYVLTFMNHNMAGLKFFEAQPKGTPGDIYSIDRYPVGPTLNKLGTPSTMYTLEHAISQLSEAAARKRLPLGIIMQCGWAVNREATPVEYEWMAYICLAYGAKSFTNYVDMPRSRLLLTRVKEISSEIQNLKAPLFSFEKAPDVTPGNAITEKSIKFMVKKHEGKVYVIAVNRLMRKVKAEFDLSKVVGIKDNAEVMFEKRTLKIDNGKLSDTFEPMRRHVYAISAK